jgi:tRNA1Val (adenine37-N6)-methyltransferase
MNPVFRFKQFSIKHDRCAMKVGTDGVLLGALTDVHHASSILDIGTGSGVIAIMLAQRCGAKIEGIEVDEASAVQARQNAASSPWHERITIKHKSFQEYFPNNHKRFDVVVCNPPFFPAHLKSPDHSRNVVRHDVSLNYPELITGVRQVMKPSGKWWLILPFTETARFLTIAKDEGFYLIHEHIIFPKAGKRPHRKIISLITENPGPSARSILTIRSTDNNYTEEYKKLTRPYYIAF